MYKEGSYLEAFNGLLPLAKGGHKGAMELIGIMYRYGQGTSKDLTKAFHFLQLAAEYRRPLAEYHLADMYYSGEMGKQDRSMALMWAYISLKHYETEAEKESVRKFSANVRLEMDTSAEKEHALQMAREWFTTHKEAYLTAELK